MVAPTRSRHQIWYGRDQPPAEPRLVRAGELLLELHGPDIRYARTSANEVVRRLYMAVRDLNWNTLPVSLDEARIDEGDGEFQVGFSARNLEGDIDFSWRGTIEGSRDGTVSYEMIGAAGSAFAFAKIGLCLHHAVRETAGRLFRGRAPSTPVGGELPRSIAPQMDVAAQGWHLPLFDPVEWLEIDLPHGERITFDFEGDLFEMEDQRNWTDASLKTSSTPASLGYRHASVPGRTIRQKVTFRVEGASGSPRPRSAMPAVLHVGGPSGGSVPPVGLGMPSHDQPASAREIELLRHLAPAHLRVEVELPEDGSLERGLADASAIGAALELALFVDEEMTFVDAIANAVARSGVPVARVLVLHRCCEVTPVEYVDAVRKLWPDATVGGGTNVYFNELNRHRPDHERLDVVAYGVNPQIHAFDELSLVESLEAQGETVRSARGFCGGTPIAVTPITLRPRFNAVATTEEAAELGGLPRAVDPRQPSLFAAAWTLGSVKYLAEAGAASLTYFETTGWRGVIERAAGPRSPAFPSVPGEAFPLYHVLADVCELRGVELQTCEASDPLSIVGLAAGTRLLVANLEPRPKTVRIVGMSGPARLLRLNDNTVPGRTEEPAGDVSSLELAPLEVVRVDVPAAP